MTKTQQAARDAARDRLREIFKPGDKVHCVLRHVSRSGMRRVIELVKIDAEGDPRYWGRLVAEACGYRYDREREGIVVNGCGMDMGFALVYDLGRTLWPEGYGCTGEGCLSNDHSNGNRDYTPHVSCEYGCHPDRCVHPDLPNQHTHWHRDGGYALKAVWL